MISFLLSYLLQLKITPKSVSRENLCNLPTFYFFYSLPLVFPVASWIIRFVFNWRHKVQSLLFESSRTWKRILQVTILKVVWSIYRKKAFTLIKHSRIQIQTLISSLKRKSASGVITHKTVETVPIVYVLDQKIVQNWSSTHRKNMENAEDVSSGRIFQVLWRITEDIFQFKILSYISCSEVFL